MNHFKIFVYIIKKEI